MYINKCTKCGKEFETKNPKRVICPACLYPDKTATVGEEKTAENKVTPYPKNFSFGADTEPPKRPIRPEGRPYPPRNNSSYNNGGYNNNRPPRQGGGFKKPFNKFGNKKPFNRPQQRPKPPLLPREIMMQIETAYKKMLPLPNPDAHEVIATQLSQEPKKVFFAINSIRQKMMLPKVAFPKRKLALTGDQLTAIKNLYEPLLPTPPIGCHKIIAAQLRMDEWRVHVGIGLVRKQMGLERWNPDRPDVPAEFKKKDSE